MATTFSSNYYPPILETYMPAFVVTKNNEDYKFYCRIYFSLSPYTDFSHSNYMHVKVMDQRTNQTVLKSSINGILTNVKVKIDNTRTTDDRYYVELRNSDFSSFEPFNYYKVQLRSAANKYLTTADLYNDQSAYSEWSTVCLIRGITTPQLDIRYFTMADGAYKAINNPSGNPKAQLWYEKWDENLYILTEDETVSLGKTYYEKIDNTGVKFLSDTIPVRGNLYFSGEEEPGASLYNEQIKNYKISFLNSAKEVIETSGIIYPDIAEPRNIKYDSKTAFNNNQTYILKIDILTTGLYKYTELFYFYASTQEVPTTNAFQGEVYKDLDNGRMGVRIESKTANLHTVLYIRRTDSTSNFKVWEDIYSIEVNEPNAGWVMEWWDHTVESGIWYQYGFQYTKPSGIRYYTTVLPYNESSWNYQDLGDGKYSRDISVLKAPEIPIKEGQSIENAIAEAYQNSLGQRPQTQNMLVFDDSFLVGEDGQQLKITYDLQLGDMSFNQQIQKIDTIGSRYPFIRQRSAGHYRSFTITGLITVLSDEKELFIENNDLFLNENLKKLYQDYNEEYNVTEYSDYTKERFFREAVMDFLTKDDVKLFKSATEGNILVKLMEISFQPKAELGRYLYNFSATAVECGPCSIENYSKYHIQKLSNISYTLISKIAAPTYYPDKEEIDLNEQFISNFEVTDADTNLKTEIINAYKEQIGDNIPEGYYLDDILFYKISMEFLSNSRIIDSDNLVYSNAGNISGWLYKIKTLNDENTYLVNAESGDSDTKISDEGLTLEEITFPAPTKINLITDCKIIYKKDVVRDSEGNIIPDPGPQSEIVDENTVLYTQHTVVQVTSDIAYDVDLVTLGKNIKNQEIIIGESADLTLLTFNPYVLQIDDANMGSVLKVSYDENEAYETFIIGSTESLDLNLDDDTSDTLNNIYSAKFQGQLISWNREITGDYIFTNPALVKINNDWYWISNGTNYPVEFYSDLSLIHEIQNVQNIDGTISYGRILNYIDESTNPKVTMYARAGLQEVINP